MSPLLQAYLALERVMMALDGAGDALADTLRDALNLIWHALSDEERTLLNCRTSGPTNQPIIDVIRQLIDALPDEADRIAVFQAILENRCRKCFDFDPNGQFWCCHESREYGDDD